MIFFHVNHSYIKKEVFFFFPQYKMNHQTQVWEFFFSALEHLIVQTVGDK